MKRAARWALPLLIPVVGAVHASASEVETDPPETEPRHIVLISVDSLRADHLPFYGYPRDTAPFLTGLAGRHGSVVYERMTAVAPSCHPSHAAMLTGLYPQQVGIPFCGEDLVFKHADLGDDGDAGPLLEVQERMAESPARLTRKKVSAVANMLEIPEGVATLATHLQQQGYLTAGFPSIWTIHRRFGYARGFDTYADAFPHYYGPRGLTFLLRDVFRSQRRRHGEDTLGLVVRFLEGWDGTKPLFLFIHFADTHVPYRAPGTVTFEGETAAQRAALRAHRERRYSAATLERAMNRRRGEGGELLLDAYDRSIRHVDGLIERLFRHLEGRGILERTLAIVTADHGDSFGQHLDLSKARENSPFFEHSVYVWEETQSVPLLLHDGARRWPPERRAGNASTVDVVPTVLGAVRQDKRALGAGDIPGRDLGLADGAEDPRRVYFLTFGRGKPGLLSSFFLNFPRFIGFREGDLKFFVDQDRLRRAGEGRCFLYDLASDPDERSNLCDEPERAAGVARFRAELIAWYNGTIEERREIGSVGGR